MPGLTLEAELIEALKRRVAVIGDVVLRRENPSEHLAQLKAASERIGELERRLPADADPRLRHFLERRSYEKALAWLDQA